ncbi:hypothetical protein VIN7_6752 [Saccharomyces cerevisiae x Saccharomyces kudriavzevii VIN7]|uniref:Uncharacterized protein n=1 Tax=Saccharomyces cerevisiae x Saccharomyces kudriavzevii (strain VIN7) TaxID=1095631 RepID=H0GU04_SACCK|nr:hypothetical protein VIN7_6752 [Saccharomyces cerevisiae x Saccharomyces kudriavzevii VIN7]
MTGPLKEMNLDVNYSLYNSFFLGIRFLFSYDYEFLRVYFLYPSVTYYRQLTVYSATKTVSEQNTEGSKVVKLSCFIFNQYLSELAFNVCFTAPSWPISFFVVFPRLRTFVKESEAEKAQFHAV